MSKPTYRRACLAGALLLAGVGLLLALSRPSGARSRQSLDLSWWTVDGGGSTFVEGGMRSASGALSLSGTAGQPDAGQMGGGACELESGFLPGGQTFRQPRFLYLPAILRSY